MKNEFDSFAHMNFHNYPEQNGTYLAGNFNKIQNRIEVNKVDVVDGEVFAEGIGGFIVNDWSFWSNKIEVE